MGSYVAALERGVSQEGISWLTHKVRSTARLLNLGLPTCKAGTLSLEPHLQSILLWLFCRWGLANYFPRLALNYIHSS
jgi:hypothetical protein